MSVWRCPVCRKLRDAGKPCKPCGVAPPGRPQKPNQNKIKHTIIFFTSILFLASLILIITAITNNRKLTTTTQITVISNIQQEKILLTKLDLIKNNEPDNLDELTNICNKLVLLAKDNGKYIALHAKYKKMQEGKREKQLFERVNKIPASLTKANLDLYRELYDLRPDNKHYKNKLLHYDKKWQRRNIS